MREIEWRLPPSKSALRFSRSQGGAEPAPPPHQLTSSRKPTSNRVNMLDKALYCRRFVFSDGKYLWWWAFPRFLYSCLSMESMEPYGISHLLLLAISLKVLTTKISNLTYLLHSSSVAKLSVPSFASILHKVTKGKAQPCSCRGGPNLPGEFGHDISREISRNPTQVAIRTTRAIKFRAKFREITCNHRNVSPV